MTLTICCSVKGGSGTTVVAALVALHPKRNTVLVDLDGDAPAVLGLAEPAGQGLADWFDSDASADAIANLTVDVDGSTRLVPRGPHPIDRSSARWPALAEWLGRRHPFDVVIDAGLGPPHPTLRVAGDGRRTLLVTRPCYLSLVRAAAMPWRADGVVLVNEPWRALRAADIERALGIPVVARVEHDPAIARAVDSGLTVARLPKAAQRLNLAA